MNTRALGAALLGAVVTSLTAVTFQLSEASPTTAAFIRPLVSLPLLAGLMVLTRRPDRRTHRERLLAVAGGAVFTIDIVLWMVAIDDIGAGLGTLLANTQVVIVPIVTWIIFRERPTRQALLAMPVVATGLVLVTGLGADTTYGANPVAGVVRGALAACFYSGFLIMFRRSNRRRAPMPGPLFDVGIGATATALVIGAFSGDFDPTPTGSEFLWLLAVGVGAMTGWLLIGYALPRLPAAHTSFAILLQPCLTVGWGALILAERPSSIQLSGVVIVLGGIAFATTPRGGEKRQSSSRSP